MLRGNGAGLAVHRDERARQQVRPTGHQGPTVSRTEGAWLWLRNPRCKDKCVHHTSELWSANPHCPGARVRIPPFQSLLKHDRDARHLLLSSAWVIQVFQVKIKLLYAI